MTENHEIDEEFDEELAFQNEPTYLKEKVFECEPDSEKIPSGFTAVTVSLDGNMHSSLCWHKATQKARYFIESGYKVLFDLELGLFKNLTLPLKSEVQFQALALSVDHFQNHIAVAFQEHMVGVILLRSNLLFQKELIWNEHLEESFQTWVKEKKIQASEYSLSIFCRNIVVEYLELLVNHLFQRITPFVLVDATCLKSALLFAQLTASDCYRRLHLAICEPLFAQGWTLWQKGNEVSGYIGKSIPQVELHSKNEQATIGIVLPAYDVVDPHAYYGLEELFSELLQKKIPFKVIPEEFLTIQWSGLDSLYVSPSGISKNGMRKLAGFEAAGGQINTLS